MPTLAVRFARIPTFERNGIGGTRPCYCSADQRIDVRAPCKSKTRLKLSMTIAIVGPFPPPYHGAGKNTKKIASLLSEKGASVVEVNTNPEGVKAHRRTYTMHAKKLLKTIGNLRYITRAKVTYLVPDGGQGIYFSLLYCIFARLFCEALFIHHRNYSHIYMKSIVMKVICIIHPKAEHIFLTEGMGADFEGVYGTLSNKMVVSNAALNDLNDVTIVNNLVSRPLSIGYLSNLTEDKGFFEVLEVFKGLAPSENFIFHLAGSPTGEREKLELDLAISLCSKSMKYWGSIFGSDKRTFFEGLDIFLFPTKYHLEAQPNVIIEALEAGCYVIATDRACIPDTLKGIPSACFREDANLISAISNEILRVARTERQTMKSEISLISRQRRGDAEKDLNRMLERLMF